MIRRKLKIDGILLTIVDSRTNYAKEISALLRETYGAKLNVFSTDIPHSVRAAEISAEGKSIFAHDPKGKVADAYRKLFIQPDLSTEGQRLRGRKTHAKARRDFLRLALHMLRVQACVFTRRAVQWFRRGAGDGCAR